MKRFHAKKNKLNEADDEEQSGKVYKSMGTDLTQMAKDGEIDPVIGRGKELEQVIWILSRKTKNNPVLIGEPGTGKTAVAEKLALIMNSGDCPDFLTDKKLISIDLVKVIELGLLGQLIQEVKEDGLILFMDELHTLYTPKKTYFDALKPILARGGLSLMGATTLSEFRESIEKDGAMERRFQKVFVDEPSFDECIEILNGIKHKYEEFHNVKYTPESIVSFVKLSQRYITDRFLPDKAIDLMDETGAKIRMARSKNPRVVELESELLKAIEDVNKFSKDQKFEEAYEAHERVKEIKDQLKNAKAGSNEPPVTVTKELTEEVIAKKTRIPIEKISQSQKQSLKGIESRLKVAVVGQDDAVDAVTRIIKRTKAGLKDPNRPDGVFLFLGPTGVGKTHLVKELAKEVFGDSNRMFRLDMSEFSEPHTVSRLFGSPPGYVGYGEGTQFTEKIRRNPHCIILLDELEKANIKVLQSWLQVFEDGHMTDGQGRKVDFKNTVIIMTSNIGAKAGDEKSSKLGFASQSPSQETQRVDAVKMELKKVLPPEFINRIDEIIIFNPLEKDNLFKIIDGELNKVANKLKERDIELTWGKSIKELIMKHGYDKEMGARPLRRAIQKYIEDPIANAIIEDEVGDKIHLEYDITKNNLIINGTPVNEMFGMHIRTKYRLFESGGDFIGSGKIKSFESFNSSQPWADSETEKEKEKETEEEEETEPQPPRKPERLTDPIKRPEFDPNPIAKKKKDEKEKMKSFESFSSAKPEVEPEIEKEEDEETAPKRPVKPERPTDPIKRPEIDPNPIAKKKKTEDDVVERFLKSMKERGESVGKYIRK